MDFDGSVLKAVVPSVFLPRPGTALWLMFRRDRCFVFPAQAPGAPAGLPAASAWLQPVLAQIEASPAYREDGLVVVLADRSGPDGPDADTSARTGATAPAGGGLVPALLLSKWVTPGQQVAAAYDHFALLRSLEDIFALPRLGEAAAPGLKGFGPKVFGAFPAPAP